jgi:regulatory protein
LKNTEPSSPGRAYQYALKLLAARDYTAARLKTRLCAREFTETDAESALARLTTEGWLDDRRFAERFAESALAGGRFFGRRLVQEMRKRGVPGELADELARSAGRDRDETGDACAALMRKFPGFGHSEASERERRRVFSFLQRRGFRADIALDAMRRVRKESSASGD